MPKKPSVLSASAIPKALLSFPFRCPNCDEEFREAAIFCSDLCKDTGKFVRYFRACLLDGRFKQPDVQEALRIRAAFVLAGGYAERARRLPPATRAEVIARAKGACRSCGKAANQIDHISGGSPNLQNLQLLCSECHNKKTTATFVTITAESHPEAWAKREALLARIHAAEPTRFCDRSDWEKNWRKLFTSRREVLNGG